MTAQAYAILGVSLVVLAVLVLGNSAIGWLVPSDTQRTGIADLAKRFAGWRSAGGDADIRQALSLLDQDSAYFDARVANATAATALAGAAAGVVAFLAGGLLAGAVTAVAGLALSLPIGAALAKVTVIQLAETERQTFRTILAMYLMVLAVELRTHPVEIALRDLSEVTYSPVAIRITNEIQRRLDAAARAGSGADAARDTGLGQAMADLGREWRIGELELIGEIMRGSVFSPEALSDMILQQSETMKQSLLRRYAKRLEAQRPKLAIFALLVVLPLLVFLMVPIMESFGKAGL